MRKLTLLFLCLIFAPHFALADAPSRLGLITEEFFAPERDQRLYDSRLLYSRQDSNPAMMWHKILHGMGIENPPPDESGWRNSECGYKRALQTLEGIRKELGPQNSYQKQWAENQNKVFAACDDQRNMDAPPVMPEGEPLPARARTDFSYQLASWHFYLGDYQEALDLYESLGRDNTTPMRPAAVYMTLRCLAELDRGKEAYDRINEILADPSLKEIHADAANYKFILMYYGVDKYGEAAPALAEEHLRWLVQKATIKPEASENLDQSIADYFDARHQLDQYFPLYGPEKKNIDWWLDDTVDLTSSPRMTAVWHLAPQIEMVDWLQSSWAYNAFDTDWLLALHLQNNPYWNENNHIVEHAWQRWENGDGLEWLQISIDRVHPQSQLAPFILNAATPYFDRSWKSETQEYKEWLENIWENSIRVYLGRKEYAKALSLVTENPDFTALLEDKHHSYQPPHKRFLSKILRWLVYTGEFSEARKFLDAYLKFYPSDYKHWRTLLTQDWPEAMLSAGPYKSHGYADVDNTPILWQKMVNFLPASMLYEISKDPKVDIQYHAIASSAALTRAILLGQSRNIDEYAVIAAEKNLGMRKEILEGVSDHDSIKYTHLMLTTPRLRPIPFTLEYYGQEEDEIPFEIDVFNHNDNNWWCRVAEPDLEEDLYEAAIVQPNFGRFFKDNAEEEMKPYIEKQKAFLAVHPFRQLIDQKELDALARIPQAPEYLSNSVISKVNKSGWLSWLTGKKDETDAADLHYAVRTTRYGCQNNGSHAAYSREAFKLLHKNFANTVWAEATPYWFGCSHFRNGCGGDR